MLPTFSTRFACTEGSCGKDLSLYLALLCTSLSSGKCQGFSSLASVCRNTIIRNRQGYAETQIQNKAGPRNDMAKSFAP